MKKEDFYNESLGRFIDRLQNRMLVDGSRLSNNKLHALAHITDRTYAKVKKGPMRICMPTIRCFAFTWADC